MQPVNFVQSAAMKIPPALRKRLIYVIPATLLGTGLIAAIIWYFTLLNRPVGDGTHVYGITIAKGTPFSVVAAELEQAGVIRSAFHLRLVGRIHGLDSKIQAGDYRIADSMLPGRILEKLVTGQTDGYRFTLPEGYSSYQAAELLEQQGVFKAADFLVACTDKALLKKLGISAESAEGYLYPRTYQVGFGMDAKGLVKEMVREFYHQITELRPLVEENNLNLHQVVILASMVEKEAVLAEEKPLIASVFLNRLKVGMPLQSDPTAIYGVRHFGGKVNKQDLQLDSPYNTYRVKGLPAGPIGNPGQDSILAVLKPADTDYYYFVARQNGSHQFSRTYKEHIQGINRFLKKRK